MQSRRDFVRNIITTALLSGSFSTSLLSASSQSMSGYIKPKRLKSGQTIGLIAPSSNFMENESIRFAADILKSFGFRVKKGQYIFDRNGYLAGEDRDRAADVNAMFADKEVDAIVCIRGGYGSPRILPYLDYDVIKQNPKVIIGFSDVTALLNAIHVKTGLITFHGPNAGRNFSDYTLSEYKKVLFDPQLTTIAAPPPFEMTEGQAERENRITVITPGKAQGELIGGNLSLMVKLVGTPYEPSYKNKILFLEDVSEAQYRIDGMLTHLKLAGRLDQLAGIVFGKCTRCRDEGNTLSLEQVLIDHLKPLGIPAVRGLMIGHIKDLSTTPIGVRAELDTGHNGIKLLETAVS